MRAAQGEGLCFGLDFSGTTLSALRQGGETSLRVSALEADMGLEMGREAICVLGLLWLCELGVSRKGHSVQQEGRKLEQGLFSHPC